MLKKNRMSINAVLNAIKACLSIFFPLITYPYALRILGKEGIGKVSYGQSVISYFAMLAMLGVSIYGVREGTKLKNNNENFTNFINEVYTINILSTSVAYIFLFVILFTVDRFINYRYLIILQSVSIILTTLGVEWINIIHEDFWLITVQSIIVHIISMILLFIFVTSPEHYYIYAFITILSSGIICLSNRYYIRKYVHLKFTIKPNLHQHIKPLLIMFSNSIAISVYVNFDTTMLGWIKGDADVGLYSIAVKIYTIIKGILVAIYAVSLPRLAGYVGQNAFIEYKQIFSRICNYLSLILIPTSVGILCLSNEIMLFMGGRDYIAASFSLQILSVALIFAIYGGLITAVLNITIGKEKENLIATFWGAIINFSLNLFFIPLWGINGAALTTLISELFVFLYCFFKTEQHSKYLEPNSIIRNIIQAGISSIGIIGVATLIKKHIDSWLLRIIYIIPVSVTIYILILLLMRNTIMLSILNRIIKFKKSV